MTDSSLLPEPARSASAPLAPWVAPEIVDLGDMTDLTLVIGSQGGGECDPELDPEGCVP